jgi:hypothetical protein
VIKHLGWCGAPLSMMLRWTYLYCNRCHSCGSSKYATHHLFLSSRNIFSLGSAPCRGCPRGRELQVHLGCARAECTGPARPGENHGKCRVVQIYVSLIRLCAPCPSPTSVVLSVHWLHGVVAKYVKWLVSDDVQMIIFPPFQITCRYDFSKYTTFVMSL